MTELLAVTVAGLVVIAAATVFGPRLGVAAPLVLVAIGVAASFLPAFGAVHIEPELILEGVLPPLLYSSAVSMPAMNFRREFGAISGLSVLLVVGSALALGLFFMLVIPGLGFAWGVALGAIVSPTDAVATSIIKQTAVSKRVAAMLDGESLLNDATALVLLRTAVVAAAASFSLWGSVGRFAYSVAIAVLIGWLVGRLHLIVRRRVTDPTVNTVISFAVPFIASVPAGLLGGSGLVAAVVAGIVTGIRAPRELSPQNRLSDSQNWRTVELVLEGAVFLTMGVQLTSIVSAVDVGVGTTVLVAVGALALTILVRAAYIAPLLRVLHGLSRRTDRLQTRLLDMRERMSTSEGKQETLDELNARPLFKVSERDLERFTVRITRGLADIEYFRREPLQWREGLVVVWAGMRGAVTVAAAQTLPADTPQRSVLVLVAFAVAVLSLLVQGGTIGPLVRSITADVDRAALDEQGKQERDRLFDLLKTSAESVPDAYAGRDPTPEGFEAAKRTRLAVLAAQRSALLDARDNGTFDADVLETALANLDASEITIEMRGRLAG
ncbi:sodium/proton antiporter (CPA1 family) [Asanoa ferruginea]|uniref:Sodium/proton antiporter (CPA1 family) n=1 Tax=Asanoa ferruginea TaxID=53367 RepID=A0A3D9ZPB6_9ACTN|nr:cation:proton antiporter [Asanoa ferruginea]REF99027.1 sodium/proton antiporter (CPA1 family) [Asanoa ferruginea]GIF46289.1 peptidase [Asanoa ferruginea]